MLCDRATRVFFEPKHQMGLLGRFLSCYFLKQAASAMKFMIAKMNADSGRQSPIYPYSGYDGNWRDSIVKTL